MKLLTFIRWWGLHRRIMNRKKKPVRKRWRPRRHIQISLRRQHSIPRCAHPVTSINPDKAQKIEKCHRNSTTMAEKRERWRLRWRRRNKGRIESMEGFIGRNRDWTAEKADGFRPQDFKPSYTLKLTARFLHFQIWIELGFQEFLFWFFWPINNSWESWEWGGGGGLLVVLDVSPLSFFFYHFPSPLTRVISRRCSIKIQTEMEYQLGWKHNFNKWVEGNRRFSRPIKLASGPVW